MHVLHNACIHTPTLIYVHTHMHEHAHTHVQYVHTHKQCMYTLTHTAPDVRLANLRACSGSKNSVKILKGGYERFSAEYPFLRTQKIMYTPLVNDKLLVEN